MAKLFWYFLLSMSGALIGISLAEYFGQRTNDLTLYLFIAGLILAVFSAWGLKKYAGIGFFSKKTHK